MNQLKQDFLRTTDYHQILPNLSEEEKRYFEISVMYAPVSDLIEYGMEYLLEHVRFKLNVLQTVKWAKNMDEDLFIQYVLPYRIGKEHIDNQFYRELYGELYPQVKELNVEQAVFKVNDWLFMQTDYDLKLTRHISSPRLLLQNVFGDCGMRSILLITALRALGIPSRSAVTYWPMIDGAHCWTEVNVNKKWHFVESCNPIEAFDHTWFVRKSGDRLDSTYRSMLVTSNLLFAEKADNAVSHVMPFIQINISDRYCDHLSLCTIKIVDEAGAPVENASVMFQIPCLGRLLSIARQKTNKEGLATIILGRGDIFVYIAKDGKAAFQLLDMRKHTAHTITLSSAPPACKTKTGFKFVPPNKYRGPDVDKAYSEAYGLRLKEGVKAVLRRVQSLYPASRKAGLIEKWGQYREEIEALLEYALGQANNLFAFLENCGDSDEMRKRLSFLNALMRYSRCFDLDVDVLNDHYRYSSKYDKNCDGDVFYRYLVIPDVLNENVTAYRGFINRYFSKEQKRLFRERPREINAYLANHITIIPNDGIAVNPCRVLASGYGTVASTEVTFVAICRSLGIPARISPVDSHAEYFANGAFHSVDGKEKIHRQIRFFAGEANTPAHSYSIDYLKDGIYQTIHMVNNIAFAELFHEEYRLVTIKASGDTLCFDLLDGEYRLISTYRCRCGTVLCKGYDFTVNEQTGVVDVPAQFDSYLMPV